MSSKKISFCPQEILRFLVAGFLAVGTDAVVYFTLSSLHTSHALAKTISFLTGTVVAFIFNKYFTFKQRGKKKGEKIKFILLYVSSLAINVGVNSWVLNFETTSIAFFIATGISMTINYLGMKFWVFKKNGI